MGQRVREWIKNPKYQPQNKSELARALGVSPKERSELRAVLRELEDSGEIVRIKRGRYSIRERAGNLLAGTVRFQRNGHAFFCPSADDPQNAPACEKMGLGEADRIFIPSKYTHTALNGDRVAVKVFDSDVPKWWKHVRKKRELLEQLTASGERRIEARIIKILERRNKSIVGIFHRRGKFAYVTPDDPLLPGTIEIRQPEGIEPKGGNKVVAVIDEWQSRSVDPHGHVVRDLGPRNAPGVDILSIIHRFQLPTEFPPEVLEEAEAIDEAIPLGEIDTREDWRQREVITIDPFDAKDFDDAIAIERLDGGGWELAVHIADVSHYVQPASALDREAYQRGNSVYLVDRVLPMLPEKLSNGICSLKPEVDRLTRAAIMRFDPKGRMVGARFASAIIRSMRRLTYEEAFACMKDPAPREDDRVTQILQEAWRLASKLRTRRFDKGGLDLDFPEIKVILDSKGKPERLARIEYDESHQLIEEFMLAANEAVASATKDAQKPSIYRVHDDPDPDKLFEFGALLHTYGIHAGDLTNHRELQHVMRVVKGKPEEHAVKIALLKSMKRAFYGADPEGHYGLAKENYTHFTSPIRRYADLVVHRVIWNMIQAGSPEVQMTTPRYAKMQEIGKHISDTERTAADAEMETRKLKELEYLDQLSRSREVPSFEAMVYDVRRMGLFVELTDYFIKGLCKVEDFPGNHEWYFDRATQRYIGVRPKRKMRTGDTVRVEIARVDLGRKLVDFRLLPES